MTTHTPGPWHIQQTGSPGFFTVKGPNFKPVTMQGPTGEANARLMAAGPALLTLAYQFARECGTCDGTRVHPHTHARCAECQDIWDVIASAGGETQLPASFQAHWDADTLARWQAAQSPKPDPVRVIADLLDFWQRFEPDVFDEIRHPAMDAAKAIASQVTGSRAPESDEPQP